MLLSFISLNNYFLYYASQTYSEAFFLAIQSFCIYVTFITIDAGNKYENWKTKLHENYLNWTLFGLSFLVLYLSKSIAIACIPGVVLYLILKRDYRHAIFAFISFAVFLILYTIITTTVYGSPDISQWEMMLRKDIYHPELGHENFSGIIYRFSGNFVTYIGVHALRIMHLKNSDPMVFDVDILILVLSVIFFLFCLYKSYKKNNYVFYSAIYVIAMCTIIFLGVHASNTQDRLIIVVMPLIFMVSSYMVYEFANRFFITRYLLTIFSLLMLFITIGKSLVATGNNISSLKKNLKGDIYYGYTPDWQNYLKMSRYCADSLPPDAIVLSRKPSNSFIYAHGKKFKGQFYVSTRDADSVLLTFKNQKIQYAILARLRVNPNVNDGRFITTIHKMIEPILIKYPEKIKVVKIIGDDEYATLCEIHY
jgi:4-amino-4-deoxy-L-arabinose transferase-like glycosyltransferase